MLSAKTVSLTQSNKPNTHHSFNGDMSDCHCQLCRFTCGVKGLEPDLKEYLVNIVPFLYVGHQ